MLIRKFFENLHAVTAIIYDFMRLTDVPSDVPKLTGMNTNLYRN